jgi:hypothetical protein
MSAFAIACTLSIVNKLLRRDRCRAAAQRVAAERRARRRKAWKLRSALHAKTMRRAAARSAEGEPLPIGCTLLPLINTLCTPLHGPRKFSSLVRAAISCEVWPLSAVRFRAVVEKDFF